MLRRYFFFLVLCSFFQCCCDSYILYDVTNDVVLDLHQEGEPHPPASLTQIMTAYVVLDEVQKKSLSLEKIIVVPEAIKNIKSHTLGLKAGNFYSLRKLLNAVLICSSNEAAIALAVFIAGSQEAFAEKMMALARKLGMTKSVFKNPTGLPHPQQVTSAFDMMILARSFMKDYPKFYEIMKKDVFILNKRAFPNSNIFLNFYENVDGLKSEPKHSPFYNFSISRKKEGIRYIAIALGEKNQQIEKNVTSKLLGPFSPRKDVPNVLIVNKCPKKNKKKKATKGAWVLQLGQFKNRHQAQVYLSGLQTILNEFPDLKKRRVLKDKRVYRVYLGGFDHPSFATHLCREILKKNISCFVTNLT